MHKQLKINKTSHNRYWLLPFFINRSMDWGPPTTYKKRYPVIGHSKLITCFSSPHRWKYMQEWDAGRLVLVDCVATVELPVKYSSHCIKLYSFSHPCMLSVTYLYWLKRAMCWNFLKVVEHFAGKFLTCECAYLYHNAQSEKVWKIN